VYRKIVVAFDGSDGARAALQSAAALAGASGGMVQLVESTGHLERADEGAAAGDPSAESSVRHTVEEAAEQLEEVSAVTRVVREDPVAGIIGAAEDIGADLIVVGSRGRALMPEAVLGRVSSGVVSNSPCDVLVVHPQP
jgi:nucleotide-binding universal stress UspA family protein